MRSRGGGANEGNSGEVVTGSEVVTGGRERVTAGQLACEVLGPEQAGDNILQSKVLCNRKVASSRTIHYSVSDLKNDPTKCKQIIS